MFDITILYLMVCCSKSIRSIESPGVPVLRIGNCFFVSDIIVDGIILLSCSIICCFLSHVTWTHHYLNNSQWFSNMDAASYEWMAPCVLVLVLGFEMYSGGLCHGRWDGANCNASVRKNSMKRNDIERGKNVSLSFSSQMEKPSGGELGRNCGIAQWMKRVSKRERWNGLRWNALKKIKNLFWSFVPKKIGVQ